MRLLATTTASILAATFVAAAWQVAPPQDPTESIAGTVMRADIQAPLSDVRLELVREDYARIPTGYEKPCRPEPDRETTELKKSATTDANGKFKFTGIVPGKYYLYAEREGFLKAAYGQRGRHPIPSVLRIGTDGEDLFSSDASTSVATPADPTTPPRGGLGRGQEAVRGGATSAIRDGTLEQTGQRGGLGRDAERVAAGAASAISDAGTGNARNLLQSLEIAMTPAPTITGDILDERGVPLAAASVQVYQFRYTPLNGRTLKSVRAVLTNDDGKYRAFWLDPARYVVAAGYSEYGLRPWVQGLNFTPNLPNADSGYPITFYPADTTAANAIVVPLDPGSEPFAEIRLRPRRRLTARIRLTGDRIPTNTSLVFVPAGGDLCAAADYGITAQKDGTFEIRDVPEGIYVAAAMSGRDFISDLLTMKVENGAPNQASLPVTEPTTIRGNIYFEGLLPGFDLGRLRISLTRTGQELHQVATAVLDPSTGRFSIPGLGPGSYYPTVDLPPGLYVDNVGASKFDINNRDDCSADETVWSPTYKYLEQHGHLDAKQPLLIPQTIPVGRECVAIKVKLGNRIIGVVQNRVGRSVSGAFVVAIPKSVWAKSDDGGVTPPDRILVGTSDGTGRFVLWGATQFLFPGSTVEQEYHLLAFEDIDPNLIYDPGFAERFRGHEIFAALTEQRLPPDEMWNGGSILTTFAKATTCDEETPVLRERCVLTAIPASETVEIR